MKLRIATTTLLLLIGGIACAEDLLPEDPDSGEADPCEACLEAGGTWQPEVAECTRGCGIMDVSCYTESCPGACEDDCGNCFSPDACEAAGCTWRQEEEAMWCTSG